MPLVMSLKSDYYALHVRLKYININGTSYK